MDSSSEFNATLKQHSIINEVEKPNDLLFEIHKRYQGQKIYTNIGHLTLSLNPFHLYPNNGDETQELVGENPKSALKQNLNHNVNNAGFSSHLIDSHITEISSKAYNNMITSQTSQFIILNGIRGSGKTTSSRLIHSYLCENYNVRENKPRRPSEETGASLCIMKKKMNDASKILEVFSSRKMNYGTSSCLSIKTNLYFSKTGHVILGGSFENIFLESSRILDTCCNIDKNPVTKKYHCDDSSNFIIFYLILAISKQEGNEWMELGNYDKYPRIFRNVEIGSDSSSTTKNQSFQKTYSNLVKYFECLGNITSDEIRNIKEIIVGILHLSNIKFNDTDSTSIEDKENSLCGDSGDFIQDTKKTSNSSSTRNCTDSTSSCLKNNETGYLKHISKLLGLSQSNLERILCNQGMIKYSNSSSNNQSMIRDNLIRNLFSNLLDWLIQRINSSISSSHPNGKVESEQKLHISTIDLIGSTLSNTASKSNNLDQLCINYANDRLQDYFVSEFIDNPQKIYPKEEIEWKLIECERSELVCSIVDSKDNPIGIITSLDDSTIGFISPRSLDETDKFFEKLLIKSDLHNLNPYFTKPSENQFTISHYSGDITYTIKGFSASNIHTIDTDVISILAGSSNGVICEMYSSCGSSEINTATTPDRKVTGTKTITLLKSKIDSIVNSLQRNTSQCHFVYCVNSNSDGKYNVFDSTFVRNQLSSYQVLKYYDMVSKGYFTNVSVYEFFRDFRFLSSDTWPLWDGTSLNGSLKLLQSLSAASGGINNSSCGTDKLKSNDLKVQDFLFGKTKLFIKYSSDYQFLHYLRNKVIEDSAKVIQRFWRRIRFKVDHIARRRSMEVLMVAYRKDRRAGSFYREYEGLYLNSRLQQAFKRIVESSLNNQVTGNIVFSCEVNLLQGSDKVVTWIPCVVIITDTSQLYLSERSNDGNRLKTPLKIDLSTCIDRLLMSSFPDQFLLLGISPHQYSQCHKKSPEISHWNPDEGIHSCEICRSDFTIFSRRHHCRSCGRVVCNTCSKHRVVLPDFRFFDKKVRICNECVLTTNRLLLEDLVVTCEHRNELASFITQYSGLLTTFSDNWQLRSAPRGSWHLPGKSQLFKANESRIEFKTPISRPHCYDFTAKPVISIESNQILVRIAPNLPLGVITIRLNKWRKIFGRNIFNQRCQMKRTELERNKYSKLNGKLF